MNRPPKIVLAANRPIGLEALHLLLDNDIEPVALLLPEGKHADPSCTALRRAIPKVPVLAGREFREARGIELLKSIGLDYLLSIHFPYLLPNEVLEIPRVGVLNLHPSYLPYNRGWHTPSWAILDETPYGATLHWVDEGMDTGDIALQERVDVLTSDTAHSLYRRVLEAELGVLRRAVPLLQSRALPRSAQRGVGTEHLKSDLRHCRQLQLDEQLPVREVLRRIRALTTSRDDEAAWFESDGERYLVQIRIQREPSVEPSVERPALRNHRAA